MQPNPTKLINRIDLTTPLIGLYDAPDPNPFKPLIKSSTRGSACIFLFYKKWLGGKTLHLTRNNYGCSGCGHAVFGIEPRSRNDYIEFLIDDIGFKASRELINLWLEYYKPYGPDHENILIGPLREDQYQYLKSVTFYVNPDQLGALIWGANYYNSSTDPIAVITSFGSGCMGIIPMFKDLNAPQAIIGATDISVRQYFPPNLLAFTVTKSMFEQLCGLDEKSFIYKPFIDKLKKVRRNQLSQVV